MPCVEQDLGKMRQMLDDTNALRFGSDRPSVAKNKNKEDLNDIWTEFLADVIA